MFEDYYGFSGKPFQLTPDPAFYYESLTHRKALSYLGFGLAQGEGFIVITGEVGTGKSTLVGHLMATIDRQRLTAAQIVTSRLDGEEIVHVIARAFGLAVEGHDKATALGCIESFLHDEARNGRRCLLVVDESQNLAIDALEELRMLSNFQLGNHPLLQILLLGQPEFRDSLQGHPRLEQLRQRVIAAHHLEAMEPTEVEPYVMHRLRLVGWQGNPVFDQRLFTELYGASGGIPRRINQIFGRLLLLGAIEQRRHIDGLLLAQVIAEMTRDGALALGRPASAVEPQAPAVARAAAAGYAPPPSPPQVAGVPAEPARSGLDDVIAGQAAQIAELQQAVLELSNSHDFANPDPEHEAALAAVNQRLAQVEARLAEQDRTIRHTLTMLIEWIERENSERFAA